MTFAQQLENRGLQQGERGFLTRQLRLKFQSIPKSYLEMIEAAHSDSLLAWGEKVLEAQTLEEVFGED